MSTTTVDGNNTMNNHVQYHHRHHRRGLSFNAIPTLININNNNNNSDHHLCSNNTRRTLSSASSNNAEKLSTSGFDDLLSSTDGGKHDYDWLLTPPRSPDFQAPIRSSLGKPTSSSWHAQITEKKNELRAGRNSSVTRSSISSTTTSQSRTSSRMLNTTSAEKTRPPQIPRPYIPVNSPPSPARSFSTSRPGTPTRRHSSAALISKHCNSSAPTPQRSSSASRRRPMQPVVPADFPLETPANLRTTLPADRPVSAGRSRPAGAASTLKASSCEAASLAARMRQASPIGKGRNGHHEPPRISHAPPSLTNNKASTSATHPRDSNENGLGLGRRSISKKSLDMAIKNMEGIRRGRSSGSVRTPTALFPQSIRATSSVAKSKTQPPSPREINKIK